MFWMICSASQLCQVCFLPVFWSTRKYNFFYDFGRFHCWYEDIVEILLLEWFSFASMRRGWDDEQMKRWFLMMMYFFTFWLDCHHLIQWQVRLSLTMSNSTAAVTSWALADASWDWNWTRATRSLWCYLDPLACLCPWYQSLSVCVTTCHCWPKSQHGRDD